MVKAGFTKNNQKVHTHTDIHTYIHRHTERNERRQEQFDALQTKLITPFLPKGTTTATARGGPMFPDSPTPTNHPHRPPSHFLTHCCCTASDEFSRYTFTFIHLQQEAMAKTRAQQQQHFAIGHNSSATRPRYWQWCGWESSASTVKPKQQKNLAVLSIEFGLKKLSKVNVYINIIKLFYIINKLYYI